MRKYRVEFAEAENFTQVEEWNTINNLDIVEAETAEEAAKWASYTDGLENVLFRIYELVPNEFGELEKTGKPEYFEF